MLSVRSMMLALIANRRGSVVSLFLACVLLVPSAILAADQVIGGKKLLIKNPPSGAAGNKVVHLGKDVSITVGAAGSSGDPQCTGAGGGGGSLRIAASGGAGDVTIPLPCEGWTTNAANTLYKYKDTSGTTCRLVLVKNGVLTKAICKGYQVGIDLNASMSPTIVVTTLNAESYCTEYGGAVVKDGSDDKTFLRKDALPPAGCPTTTTSTVSTTSTSTSSTTSSSTTSTTSSSTTSTTVAPKYVFLSPETYFPAVDFVDLAGADALCQAAAVAASLPGTYMAWLSDTTQSPSTRFTHSAGSYILPVSGTVVANDWTDLTDGSLDGFINTTAAGTNEPLNHEVWTGTQPSGAATGSCCFDWTSSHPLATASYGHSTATNLTWTDGLGSALCGIARRLYCFQQ